jgi:hypothetical protein
MSVGSTVGLKKLIQDDLRRNFGTKSFPPAHFYYFLFVDFWLGALLFYPLSIAVFRGTWQNLDQLMEWWLPAGGFHGRLSTYVCLFVGMAASFSVSMTNYYVDWYCKAPSKEASCWSRMLFFAATRGFTLYSLYADTILWKGFWEVLDDLYEFCGWRVSLAATGVVLVFLISVGSLRSVMGTPLGTGFYVDTAATYLYIPTIWQMEVNADGLKCPNKIYARYDFLAVGQPTFPSRGRFSP